MMTEHSQETKIAILEAKVEHMMGHVKELTLRVRANEKVVASVSLLGVIACTIVGAGDFSPKAEACSPPLDGSEFTCPPHDGIVLRDPPSDEEEKYITDWNQGKVVLVDTREDNAFVLMDTYHKMVDKLRELKIKQNRTSVDDMINNSIANWEMEYGSDDTTDSEELLQLQSNGNSQSIRWRYD